MSTYRTLTTTTTSVSAGSTVNFSVNSDLRPYFQIIKVKIEPNSAGGSFDAKIYKSSTHNASTLLAFWDNATAVYDPEDISTGTPAEAAEGSPIPYEDVDSISGVGNLWMSVTNNDSGAHTYDVTIIIAAVPVVTTNDIMELSRGTHDQTIKLSTDGASESLLMTKINSGAGQIYITGVDRKLQFGSGSAILWELSSAIFRPYTDGSQSFGDSTHRPDVVFAKTALTLGTTPADAGIIRLPNNTSINARNQGGSANVPIVSVNTSNQLYFGSGNFYSLFSAGVTINSDGSDSDTSIKSDTNANHFVSDAGMFSGVGAFGFGSVAEVNSHVLFSHPALSGPSNDSFYRVHIASTNAITIPAATTAPTVSSLTLEEPNISLGGGAAVTNAYTLVIGGAPTEGSNNGGLWIAAGEARFSSTVRIGDTVASTGNVRTLHGLVMAARNNANNADHVVLSFGSAATDALVIGGPNTDTRIRSSFATPTSLANGDWWVEVTGVSPARVAAIKARDGGVTKTIASLTY